MRVVVGEGFGVEAEQFTLRFTCADCFHYLADTGGCAHEWPNQEHMDLRPAREVVFCKEFELG